MANPFDQFDQSESNPFDQFDASASVAPTNGSNPFDAFDGKEEYGNEHRRTKQPTKAGIGTGVKAAFASMGNTADTAASMIAGGAANLFGQQEESDRIFRNMEERAKERNQWANPEQQELGFGAKAAGLIATLPMQIAGAGLSPSETGKELINAGESTGTALGGAAIDAAGNAVGMVLPGFKQGTLAVRAATGAGANAAQEVATKAAISGLADTKEGKEKFAPNTEDAILAAALGGSLGAAAGSGRASKAPTRPSTKLDALDAALTKKALDAPVKAAEAEILSPMARMATDLGADPMAVTQAGLPRSPMSDMADSLQARPEQAAASLEAQRMEAQGERAAGADEAIAARQAAMEQEVARQTSLDQNAALRARQEGAPVLPEARAEAEARAGAELEQRLAADSQRMREAQQMEIDDTQHVLPDSGEIYGAQYGTGDGVGRIDENGMPIRADRSIEAQQLENPLQRNLWGDELDPALGQDRSLTDAIDLMPKGPERTNALSRFQSFNSRTKGQGGAIGLDLNIRRAKEEAPVKWYTASPEAGRKTGYSLAEQSARPNAEEQRYGPGQYISANRDFSSVYGGPTGRMYTVEKPFERPFDMNSGTNEKVYQRLVEASGSRAGANAALERAGYDAITFTSPRGDQLANIFKERPLQDIGPAREKIREQVLTLEEYQPGRVDRNAGSTFGGKQGGFIRFGKNTDKAMERVKGIDAFREKIGKLAVDRSPPEEFIAANRATPDIDQNLYQKAANLVTKGSIYMQDRLNNPLYKRVTDRFREADSLAKGQQQAIVHDIYAPAVRKLSLEEQADVWGALKKMEAAKTRLTGDELVELGFNQNQRDLINIHQKVMDTMVPKINEALDAIGMSHIDSQAAFVAAKLDGTFRRVMLDKDNNVIGALGARTTSDLARQTREFKKLYPDAVEGEMQTMGSRGNSSNMADVINFLSDKDPHMAEFLKKSQEAGAAEAMSYRGAKTHTMDKKGVVGMAGNKPWESAIQNARDGFDAQMKYLNRMLEWAEKAKAEADVRPILDSNELNMPNAKQLASDYRDYALGQNPYAFAKISDAIGEWMDTTMGGKLSYVSDAAQVTRKLTNLKLLSMSPGFLASNGVQPFRNMPELAAYIGAKGGKDMEMMGLSAIAKVSAQLAYGKQTGEYSPLMADAIKYAGEHHVYASDLIDQRQGTSRFGQGEKLGDKIVSSAQALDHLLQKPASILESTTRQAFFHAIVDILHTNGVKQEDGLFDIAANLTDRGMNRYSMDESPVFIKAMGGAGRYPYNLMSFKFNELSRLASLARDMSPKDLNTIKPFATALMMQVAMAGLKGMVGYVEADYAVKLISEAMGKPTSLTKLLFDNADMKIVGPVSLGDVANGGLSTATGVDFTQRLSVGALAGSPPGADMLMPGAGAVGTAAKSGFDFAKDPSKYNAAKAAIDILPGGALLDRHLFSQNTYTDNEIGFSRNKMEAGIKRTPADKIAKTLGMTGLNEATKKGALYENQRIDKVYEDKRMSAVDSMAQDFFMNGNIDKKYIDKFLKAQGNAENLESAITRIAMEQKIPSDIRDKLKVAAEQGISGAGKIKRRFH